MEFLSDIQDLWLLRSSKFSRRPKHQTSGRVRGEVTVICFLWKYIYRMSRNWSSKKDDIYSKNMCIYIYRNYHDSPIFFWQSHLIFVATPVFFSKACVCLFHPRMVDTFLAHLELRLRSKKRFLKQVEKSKMKLTEQRRWAAGLQGWLLDGLLVWLDGFCWLGWVGREVKILALGGGNVWGLHGIAVHLVFCWWLSWWFCFKRYQKMSSKKSSLTV